MLKKLTAWDFAQQFGCGPESLSVSCLDKINNTDFSYEVLDETKQRQVILEALKRIDSGTLSLAGQAGQSRWEKGWAENLQNLLDNDNDLSQLVPRFIRPGMIVRLNRQYVQPVDPQFELNWYSVFRQWIFDNLLINYNSIYEFGCGSGHNLASLAEAYPDKKLYGLDWASASVEILEQLAKKRGWKLHGKQFDFFNPDHDFAIEQGSAVFTIGAIEQTGDKFEPLLQYLLKQKPAICVHVEPIVEWYDPDNLLDYLGIRFLSVRKYMSGFPARMQELAKEGRIEILKQHRSFVGSMYVEGYNQFIWRPLP